jgi:hypothetical protein
MRRCFLDGDGNSVDLNKIARAVELFGGRLVIDWQTNSEEVRERVICPIPLMAHHGEPLVFQADLRYRLNMKRSINKATPKRRGRPATGKAPTRTIRLSDEFMAKVDDWTAQQPDKPGRSEAIRRLVELGLTAPNMDSTRKMLVRGEDPTMPAPKRKK